MIVDSRVIPQGALIEADLCVLGGGAAGITIAREFDDTNTQVCLLESGGVNLDVETQALYQGEVVGWPYWPLDASRIRFFGGTTNHWGGLCIPLNDDDFEVRPWVPNSGWPVSKEDLASYYQRALPVFGLGQGPFDLRELWAKRWKPPWPGEVITSRMAQQSSVRFGLEYKDQIENSNNISLYLFGNAVKLLTNADRTRLEAVKVSCLSGTSFEVKCQRYVLAIGGIENPRLLLESHSENGIGLGNDNGLVGRYFSDHPYFSNLGFLQITDPACDLDVYGSRLTATRTQVRFHLELTPDVRERESLLTARVDVNPVEWRKFSIDRGSPRASLTDRIGRKLERIIRDLRGSDEPKDVRDRPEEFGAAASTRLYGFGAWLEVIPRSESRVFLGEERDALGLRKPILDWRIGEEEKQNLMRSLVVMAEQVGRLQLGRMRVDLDEESPWPWEGGGEPGLHQMGTTRMSETPSSGVVDANCRLHGVSNLFVAGSSVFPTYGVANPTLTIVALALRLADHLKTIETLESS